MLIYVATFPRCGASLLRSLIYLNFGYPTANGYGDNVLGTATDDTWSVHQGKRLLRPPALPRLDPEFRKALANDSELYFVKTHEQPFDAYFDGEAAIQLTRDPFESIASAYRLELDLNPHEPHSIREYIDSVTPSGSWSDYHLSWLDAPLPVLRMRYEDVILDPSPLVEAMGALIGRPTPDIARTISKAEATQNNPLRNKGAGSNWREFIVGDYVDYLWNRHQNVATRLNYTRPPAVISTAKGGPHAALENSQKAMEASREEARALRAQIATLKATCKALQSKIGALRSLRDQTS